MNIRSAGLAMTLLLAACSTAPTQPASSPPSATSSGFLQDYSLLVPDPQDPGYRHYVAPDMRAGHYRRFIIEDPVFMINTHDTYGPLNAGRLQTISAYYKSRMTQALSKHYQVVQKPGQGVARLRVAVVGLLTVQPQFKIRDLVPAKALFDVARAVADKTPHMLQISIESEALDSKTGQLLGATVDSRESKKTVSGNTTQPSDDQVHDLIDFWVARFVSRLDHANGYPVAADGQDGM